MKKGFTLIELLAVIVILAIIALIATPLILGVIDTARKGAFQSSAYGIIESAEQGYTMKSLSESDPVFTKYTYTDGDETLVEGNVTMTYKGSKPNSGTLLINTTGQVSIAFYKDGYCAQKKYTESEVRVTKGAVEDCLLEDSDTPVSNVAFNK